MHHAIGVVCACQLAQLPLRLAVMPPWDLASTCVHLVTPATCDKRALPLHLATRRENVFGCKLFLASLSDLDAPYQVWSVSTYPIGWQ